ncbi:MAG: ECF transporter S component [Mycoplasmatales bacterium]
MNNRKHIQIALFTAGAIVLTLFTIPLPGFGFLQLDLSVVLIYLIFDRIGTKAGYFSLFITMAFNAFLKGLVAFGIGQISYIIAFLLFYYFFIFLNKKSNRLNINAIITTILMMIFMTIFNYFIITPLYGIAFGGNISDSIIFTFPNTYFNKEYFIFIIALYPVFNLVQWGINISIIAAITRAIKKENKY